jgi:N-acetylneuraminic acid mutarotase
MRATYDAESDRTVLLAEDGTTWAYDADADAWRESAAEAPPSRLWHAMAYDEGSDRVIVFGGTTRSDADLGDTWAYDLNTDTWQEMAPVSSPPPRRYAAMAYDPGTDRIVLFGGVTGRQEEPLNDTWAYDYDTNTWTAVSPATAPSPRGWHAMAQETGTGTIVLFGGGRTRDEATAETWLFDPLADKWGRSS